MSSLDYMRRKRFINALVSDTSMRYAESDSYYSTPNNSTIVMPTYKADFTDEQDQEFMSELIQKCYHAMPDNIEDSQQNLDREKPFTAAHNIVCRSNAQKKRQGILPGADEYMQTEAERDAARFVNALQNGAELPPELQAVKAFDIKARSHWQTDSDFGVREALSPEAQAMLDKMLNDDTLLNDYLEHRNGGEPNIEMTRRLLEEATDEEQAQQMQDEAQQSQQEGEGEDGEGQQGESGASQGQEGEGDGEEEGPQSKAVYDPDHECLDGFDVNQIGNNQTIEYPDKNWDGEFTPLKTDVVIPNGDVGNASRKQDVERAMSYTLSKKVRNVLKVYSQARYAGGKKKGKINKRAIASITTGNDRIFRTKEVKDVLDTSVMLLVDTSGSMGGSKYTHATAATAMLNDCLSKLNIPHAIYGFTTSSENKVYEHKRFNQSLDCDSVINNMCSSNIRMSGNDDADSVMFVHDKLIQQKSKRKILIVLSDGQPTDPWGCDAPAYLKKVVGDIETKSPVEIYGLGILTDCVKEYYSKSVVINDCSNLEDSLLNLLKDSILS